MKKIVHIVGPTGVGKTDLAFKLAQLFDGELVSADSVQVYKGLDIISGKDIPTDSDIPIHLIDIVVPSYSFTVSHFKDLVLDKIKELNRPIVVGGTGLYIKALIDDIGTVSIKPNMELRNKLTDWNVLSLQSELERLNSEKLKSMNNSDKNNKRRLVRAIEISSSEIRNEKAEIRNKEFEHLQIGLMAPREFLKERIEKRVEKRLKEGAIEEAKSLFKDYVRLSPQVKNANGYKQLFEYLSKKTTLEEAIEKWKISEYRHAKNQMTWFLKDTRVKWFDITDIEFEAKIKDRVKEFLQ